MWAFVLAPGCALSLLAAWLLHTRVRGWLPEDAPRAGRKRHERPTPMAGFLPGALSIGICLYADWPWLAAAAAAATVAGAFDDFQKEHGDGLAWYYKALGLLLSTALATVHVASGSVLEWQAILAVAAWIFMLTNAANFLDNADGVAASLGSLGLLLPSAGQGPAAALGFIWLGFLPFNWPRARLFLGDAGAFCIGTCLAAITAKSAWAPDGAAFDWRLLLAPTAVFVLDFVQVVTARLALGYAPWVGDRRHLTHIAMNRGVKPRYVAPLCAAAAVAAFFLLRPAAW